MSRYTPPTRRKVRHAVIAATRVSGCTCDVEITHDARGWHAHHDDWCPMREHPMQLVLVPGKGGCS